MTPDEARACIVSALEAAGIPAFAVDVEMTHWARESASKLAQLSFRLYDNEAIEPFTLGKCARSNSMAGSRYLAVFIELDDAEQPVDLKAKGALYHQQPREIKGPTFKSLAQMAGFLCAHKAFQQFMHATSEDDAAINLRQRCGIPSRRELDSNPLARRIFTQQVLPAWDAYCRDRGLFSN